MGIFFSFSSIHLARYRPPLCAFRSIANAFKVNTHQRTEMTRTAETHSAKLAELLPAAAVALLPDQQQPMPNKHHSNSNGSSSDLKRTLKRILLDPTTVPISDITAVMHHLLEGHASPAQTAAFLVVLRASGRDHDPAVVAASARVMQEHAAPVPLPSFDQNGDKFVVDIVGTGGDGHDTYNVSTTAALVAAGAGCTVAKHGNRASSSSSGSADLLEAAGCAVAAVKPEHVDAILAESGFCFLFAPTFHPAMRHVAPTRRELGVPSLFNILGPLGNPARPHGAVIGVYASELAPVAVESLRLMGVRRAMVVCGREGLDEISPAGPTDVWNLLPSGQVTTETIHPNDFGLPAHPLSSVRGGDAPANAALLRTLLSGGLPRTHPIVSFVSLNAAALIYVAGQAPSMTEAVERAVTSIMEGGAMQVLDGFCARTQALVQIL
ncbi:glycosyl transferase family, a/b domain-containing protein [Blastocladiella britannica]|nr:glycosyl transferase family, a/b domain-containing protein [Blastocladiella britannica]